MAFRVGLAPSLTTGGSLGAAHRSSPRGQQPRVQAQAGSGHSSLMPEKKVAVKEHLSLPGQPCLAPGQGVQELYRPEESHSVQPHSDAGHGPPGGDPRRCIH